MIAGTFLIKTSISIKEGSGVLRPRSLRILGLDPYDSVILLSLVITGHDFVALDISKQTLLLDYLVLYFISRILVSDYPEACLRCDSWSSNT